MSAFKDRIMGFGQVLIFTRQKQRDHQRKDQKGRAIREKGLFLGFGRIWVKKGGIEKRTGPERII